jgi:hypothetical protein
MEFMVAELMAFACIFVIALACFMALTWAMACAQVRAEPFAEALLPPALGTAPVFCACASAAGLI